MSTKEELMNGNIVPSLDVSGAYKRYINSDTGISPRAIPGMRDLMYVATGLEHTEKGSPDYSPENHMFMTEKRYRKLNGALIDLPVPVAYFDGDDLDVGVIGWGSTFGSVMEAVAMAREKNRKVGALKITSIYPFHAEAIRSFMKKCKEILIPELNFTGQLANLIGVCHSKEVHRLNKVTGVPISPATILFAIEELLTTISYSSQVPIQKSN